MSNRKEMVSHIIDVFNSGVNREVSNPIEMLKKAIKDSLNYDIPERSLLYALLADYLYENCDFDAAYDAAYFGYKIDENRREVLHSLMNLHLPRINHNNNNKLNKSNNNSNESDNKEESQYCHEYEDYEKALYFVKKLETTHGTDWQALNMVSVAYNQLQLFDDAIRVLLAAYEILNIKSNKNNLNNNNNNESDNSDQTRKNIEKQITNSYLARYRACPDEENFMILKYLIELITFENHTLNSEQYTMAIDEICERAEYVLEDSLDKQNYVVCQRVITMITGNVEMTKKLIGKIANFYDSSNQLHLGIKYFTNVIQNDMKNRRQRMAFHYFRGCLYRELNMPNEAKKDFDSAIQLGKLRTRGAPDSPFDALDTYRNSVSFSNDKNIDILVPGGVKLRQNEKQDYDIEIGNNKEIINNSNDNNDIINNIIYISPRVMTPNNLLLTNDINNANEDEIASDIVAQPGFANEEIECFQSDYNKMKEEKQQLLTQLRKMEDELNVLKEEKTVKNAFEDVDNGESRLEMNIKLLNSQLQATKDELDYFRTQWTDIKVKYEEMNRKLRERDAIISDLRIEREMQKDNALTVSKELSIMKDANSKTKLRRRSQMIENTINTLNSEVSTSKVLGNRKKNLLSMESPWITRTKNLFSPKTEIKSNINEMGYIVETQEKDNIIYDECEKNDKSVFSKRKQGCQMKLIGFVCFVIGFIQMIYWGIILFNTFKSVSNNNNINNDGWMDYFDQLKNEILKSMKVDYWKYILNDIKTILGYLECKNIKQESIEFGKNDA